MVFPISTRRRISACIDAAIGTDACEWYASALQSVYSYVQRMDEADSMVAYLAIASPRVQVSRSVKIAKYFFETGRKLPGTMEAIYKRLVSYQDNPIGFQWSPKVLDFRNAILGDTESIVIDIHISRAFGFSDGYPMGMTKKAVRIRKAIKKYITKLSPSFDLTPRDLQAVIWCGWCRFNGLNPGRIEL